MTRAITLLAVLLAWASLSAQAAGYDPDGYHECILDNIKENMGKQAVVVIRQACAHKNGTTPSGGKPPPEVQQDSFISQMKRNNPDLLTAEGCAYPMTLNDCIVYAVRDAWYPSRSFEEVREWLFRSQDEHGPMPPREDNR